MVSPGQVIPYSWRAPTEHRGDGVFPAGASPNHQREGWGVAVPEQTPHLNAAGIPEQQAATEYGDRNMPSLPSRQSGAALPPSQSFGETSRLPPHSKTTMRPTTDY